MCHQSFMDMYGAKQQHMLHHVVWSGSFLNKVIRKLVKKYGLREKYWNSGFKFVSTMDLIKNVNYRNKVI